MLGDYDFEILLKNTTLQECESFIKDNSEDMYLVPGGYKVKSIILLGTTSPVGFSGNDIIFQYTKPCFGFFVLKLEQYFTNWIRKSSIPITISNI